MSLNSKALVACLTKVSTASALGLFGSITWGGMMRPPKVPQRNSHIVMMLRRSRRWKNGSQPKIYAVTNSTTAQVFSTQADEFTAVLIPDHLEFHHETDSAVYNVAPQCTANVQVHRAAGGQSSVSVTTDEN